MKTPKIQLLSNRVLIKRDENPATSECGIIIPEGALEKPRTGVVVAVGPGKVVEGKTLPMYVKVGDRVMFPLKSNFIKLDGETYLSMIEDDIWCVLE